jgi:hypothetical protein
MEGATCGKDVVLAGENDREGNRWQAEAKPITALLSPPNGLIQSERPACCQHPLAQESEIFLAH